MVATTADIKTSIANYLTSKSIPPTNNWLQTFIPTIRPTTPIPALQKTALFRLLSTDLTTSIQTSTTNVFPANIADPATQERRIAGPVPLQILDVEDIGHSRWSQVESIEAQERGETTKGQEIIRVVPEEDGSNDAQQTTTGSGPHKLLLQDAKGTKVYGFEMEVVNGVGVQQMAIGAKLVLRDAVVARGMVLMMPKCVEVLGGKVEVWDKKWREERKEGLKRRAGMGEVG